LPKGDRVTLTKGDVTLTKGDVVSDVIKSVNYVVCYYQGLVQFLTSSRHAPITALEGKSSGLRKRVVAATGQKRMT
jgi:hypothetical protein